MRAFREAGIELKFEGEGENEQGIEVSTGRVLVKVDPRYYRPTEVETLLGDPKKAKEKLGWEPKTPFGDLIHEMVACDLIEAEKEALTRREGFTSYASAEEQH